MRNKKSATIIPLALNIERQSLLETLSDAVIFLDETATVLYVNARAVAMIGAHYHEIVGNTLWQSASNLVTIILYQAVIDAIHTHSPFQVEYRSPVAQTWLHVYLSPTIEGVALFFHEEAKPIQPQVPIHQSEETYKELSTLVEIIPQFVWIARPDGYVTYNNQRLIDYIATTHEQGEGYGWIAGVHPDDRQRVLDAWQTSIHSGIACEAEYRLQDGTNGAYRWFLVRGVPQKDAQGTILSWIGTCTDIDEQKQAEERITASEQNLRVLAETVPQLVWTTQPDGRLDYSNQRFRDFLQVNSTLLQGYGWRQFVHPEDIERTLMQRQISLETGQLYESEYRLRDGQTGEYRWFLARAHPVRDEAGQIIKWFGTGTDIDRQKRIEEALRQSQEQVQTLMHSNVIGIIRTEGNEIIEANATFLRMTGYSQEDLHQRRLNQISITASDYDKIMQQAHQNLGLHEYMVPYEKEYIGKDGGRLPVLVGGVMTQLNPPQMICFVLDNSARKALEQRKDSFLSIASHELRTPLTSLKLQTQMLRKQLAKQDTNKADTTLSRMEGQLNSVTRLVEELFDLSKIQAGKLEYAQEIVDLNGLLQEIVEVVQQTQVTHIITLSCPAYPVLLVGDRDRLGQVFLNLISNAIKYSPDANLVKVGVTPSAETLIISVRDYGIGIPQGLQEKIFERFYQASSQYGRLPGLGMGLYIVAEIVKHHGGTIVVESAGGEGSTFHVTLPLKRAV